jgi:hypothetical protein
MDELLATVKYKLSSPESSFEAMTLLTGHGFDRWNTGLELTLEDIKPEVQDLVYAG